MSKISVYAFFFLLCIAYLAMAFIKERGKLIKDADRNLRSASLAELERYREKLLLFRKSLPVVIVERIRRKPFEKGNEDVENMLWRVEYEIKGRLKEQREEEEAEENFQPDDTGC